MYPVSFRSAIQSDCSDLAIFADIASRRLTSFLWNKQATEGQSCLEIGRDQIRLRDDHFTHYKNWQIAESNGQTVGGLNGYILPKQPCDTGSSEVLDVVKPLNELKSIAQGTWYIAAAAAFNEVRGQGVGTAILQESERLARLTNCCRLTLMVGSFNTHAHRLYLRSGFEEWERREFLPFDGSDQKGSWILMVKILD